MKKQFSIFLMSCLLGIGSMQAATSYQDSSSGLYFNLSTTTCNVTYPSGSSNGRNYKATSYVIPETFTYSGTDYTVTSIGSNSFWLSSTTSITIPETVTSIGAKALYSMANLTSIVIPNSVTSTGTYFLYSCTSLESVTLSANVTSYNNLTCYDAPLKSVTVNATTPPTYGTDSFNAITEDCVLYVPAGSEDAYANSSWGTIFKTIMAIGESAPVKYDVTGTVTCGDTAVAGAAVKLLNDGETVCEATSGEDGTFTLAKVEEGTYTLTVTADGYEDYTTEVTINEENTTLTVALSEIMFEKTSLEDFNNWYSGNTYSFANNSALVNDWYCITANSGKWSNTQGNDQGCIITNYNTATLLVAPVKAGSISFDAKIITTYFSAIANVYKATKNDDGTFTKGDLLGAMTANNVTTSWGGTYSYSDIAEDGYVAIEIQDIYMDNFRNTYKISAANATYSYSGSVACGEMNIPNAVVTLANEENEYSDTTGTSGTFTIKDIKAGNYTLTVACEGFSTYKEENVEISADVTGRAIEISQAKTIIKGIVYAGESEDVIVGATVKLMDGQNEAGSATTSEDGSFSITRYNTISDAYTLTVTADGYKDYSEEIKPVIDTENSYTVRLELATYSVAGTVKSGDAAVAGAAVALYAADATEASYTATTDENGAFTFADVLPATYTLTATAEGYEDYSQELAVSADTADLAIELTAKEQGGETVLVNMESEIQTFNDWSTSTGYLSSISSDKYTLGYSYIDDGTNHYRYYASAKGPDGSYCIYGASKNTATSTLVVPVKGGVGGATIKFQAKKDGSSLALALYKVTKNADGSYTRGSKIGDVDVTNASTLSYKDFSYTIEDITSSEDGQYVGLFIAGYYVDNVQNTWVEEQVVASTYELAGDVYCGSDMFAGVTVKLDDTETVTDADGHYSFTKVAPGTHTLTVNKIDGYLAYSEKFELEEDDIRHDIEIEAEKSYVNIAATYYDSWSFIEGVNIKVYNSQDKLVGEYTSGDAEFSIAFEGLLDADGYYFTADKEGYMLTEGYNNHKVTAKRAIPTLVQGGTADNKLYVSMIDIFKAGDLETTLEDTIQDIKIIVSNSDDNALTIYDNSKDITLSNGSTVYNLVATETDGVIILNFPSDLYQDGDIELSGAYTLTIPAGTLAENGVPYGFDYTNLYYMEGVMVGVDTITIGNSELVDVYTTSGMMVRRQMSAAELSTLPDGLYILRSANTAVKYLKK